MLRKIVTTSLITFSLPVAGCSLMYDFEKDSTSAAGADAGGQSNSNKGGAAGNKPASAGNANVNGGAANSRGGNAATTTATANGAVAGTGNTSVGSGGSPATTQATTTTPGGVPGTSGGTPGATTAQGGVSGTVTSPIVGGTTAQGGVGQAGTPSAKGGNTPGGAATGGNSAQQGGAAGKGGNSTSTGGVVTSTGGTTTVTGGTTATGGVATGGVATGGASPTGGMSATGGTSVQANPCSPNPCAHGTCTPSGSTYSCTCSLNYFGPTCNNVRLEAINLPSADAVDADGNVVVGYSYQNGSSNTYAAQWTPSGGFVILSSDSASSAKAVSGDGLTIFGLGGTDTTIYRWVGGTQYPMGLPITPGGTAQYAAVNAANSDGTAMVGWARNPSGYTQAFRWSSSGGFDVFGPRDSSANGVSGDGTKVVGSALVSNLNVPFSWSIATRTFTNLPLPSGYNDCYANAISTDGLVVVGFCNGSGQPRAAVRWANGSVYNLGVLVSTDTTNVAYACNSDGSVVLGNGSDSWLWDGLNGIRSFMSILASANADLSQWTFLRGDAISADGKTVVGYGTYAGNGSGFIARLP